MKIPQKTLTRSLLNTCTLFLLSLLHVNPLFAIPKDANIDETKVPKFTLPNPLVMGDGTPVTSSHQWSARRRGEILDLFREHVYGHAPDGLPKGLTYQVLKTVPDFLNGKASMKEIRVLFNGKKDGPKMDILLIVPQIKYKPVPAFIGLNFGGNHTILADPRITLSRSWMRPKKDGLVVDHQATEKSRGSSSGRWPVETIIDRGYALATIYYGDIDPDFDDDFKNGIQPLFYRDGQTKPAPNEWGSIGAWSWGLSRALDYFETDQDIDAKKIAVIGHSRLGKTSLWAGAQDQRFAIIISNDSGCGGAALSRRRFGEKVKRINTSFPHWFNDRFNDYNDYENALPVDQHELIALIAPRPVYIASAAEDQWADPKGEFLSGKYAEPVYSLFGKKGLESDQQPPIDHPTGDFIRYHIRTGKHDVTDFDWAQYLDFADRHLPKK